MKKHNIELSYKDLHAIKHALQLIVYEKQADIADFKSQLNVCGGASDSEIEAYNKAKQDIEHETKLLERITEKINHIKDKYKIK
jgi:hypothetical protein